MTSFGQDVAAVVRGLDLTRVILVGHSMGGSVIVEAARLLPERTVGLVAVEALQNLDRVQSPEAIRKQIAPLENNPEATRKFIDGFVRGMFVPETDPELVEWVVNDMASAPPVVALSAGSNLLGWDGREMLKEIAVPKWVIYSDYRKANTGAAERCGMDVVMMSGVGHFVMMEDPETLSRLLGEIVEKCTQETKGS